MKNKAAQPGKKILNFISEAGMLKRVARSGWAVLGIKNAESVAEHSYRCAVIGYILAEMESADTYKVLLMALFGDLHEARISDLHKMAQRYIEAAQAEDKSFSEQISLLPEKLRHKLAALRRDYRKQASFESIIARDADILECLVQAKEYFEQGFLQAKHFMKKAPGYLRTKSAKALWRQAKNTSLSSWWFKLGEFKR